MRRWLGVGVVLAAAVFVGAGCLPRLGWGQDRGPIRVGLLHSLTGPMAISEASMVDAEVLALEELRAEGLLGRTIEWIKADGKSDPTVFAREAERLIRDEKVSVIFGCWTSACRKSVKPVVEREDHLLIYPVAYEGMEMSPNIFYIGAAPNQQLIPSVNWAADVLGYKTFYLIGSETIWARAVNAVIHDQLKAMGSTVLGEEYIDHSDAAMERLYQKLLEAKPDMILSAIEGAGNIPFYRRFRTNGGPMLEIPILSFAVSEDELRALPAAEMKNDYVVCNYFQSIDRPENLEFVRRFKARYGADRTTCDAITSAYSGVKLWAQAVREAETTDTGLVHTSMLRQSLDAPEGVISIDRESQHTWRPYFAGKVRSDGQVDILWSTRKPIRPVPYPFSRTQTEWNRFLDMIYKEWNGNWSAPSMRGAGASAL